MKKQLSIIVFALFSLIVSSQVIRSVNVTTAGSLENLASTYLTTVTNLTVTGTIDARDILTMRDKMPLLAVLDMSGSSIKAITTTAGTYGTSSRNYPINQMPEYSFYNRITLVAKTSLSSITLPTSLTSIGYYAFYNCPDITSLTFSNSITSIGNYAFYSCSGITGPLTLPTSLTSIGDYAFAFTGISGSLTLPASLSLIGFGAFGVCKGITSLTLPASLTSIGGVAFDNCTGIKTITCLKQTPPSLNGNPFNNLTSLTDVFVPTDAAVTAYKNSDWYYIYFPGTIIKKGAPSAVADLSISSIKVYATADGISIEGLGVGEKVTLYTLNGMQLQTLKSEGPSMVFPSLPNAVYLVKTAEKTFKVVL